MKTLFLFSVLTALSAIGAPQCAHADGQFTPKIDDGFTTVAEDYNRSSIIPYSSAKLPGAAKLQAFMNQTAYGAGSGWTYKTAAVGDNLQKNLKVNDYFAWVVDSPDLISPLHPLKTYNAGVVDSDGGGAVFDFTYKAGPTDPGPAHFHFLQIFSESLNGGPVSFQLDNGAHTTPFYDPGGQTDRDDHSFWFADEPFQCESDPCSNTDTAVLAEDSSADLVFNTYLVADSVDIRTGAHTVTLYGGFQWGFDYFNLDIGAPEPATWTVMLLGFGLVGSRLRRRKALPALATA